MPEEVPTWPPQAEARDHLAVAALWNHMEQLLSGQVEPAALMRQLAQMLPPLASVPANELPGIARIHLQSASHVKATMRLLAPEAFAGHDREPADTESLAAFADRLPPAAEPLVTKLIDLQIFHLVRVQQVTAHMRMHVRRARESCSGVAPGEADAASVADAAAAMHAEAEAVLGVPPANQ